MIFCDSDSVNMIVKNFSSSSLEKLAHKLLNYSRLKTKSSSKSVRSEAIILPYLAKLVLKGKKCAKLW